MKYLAVQYTNPKTLNKLSRVLNKKVYSTNLKFDSLVQSQKGISIQPLIRINPEKEAIEGVHPNKTIDYALFLKDYRTACEVYRNQKHYQDIFLAFATHQKNVDKIKDNYRSYEQWKQEARKISLEKFVTDKPICLPKTQYCEIEQDTETIPVKKIKLNNEAVAKIAKAIKGSQLGSTNEDIVSCSDTESTQES